MNPTHLFPGQPPEVDFLNQKLANFCAVGPAITRARAHSTSRGRGVLIGRAAPVGAGRAAGCWLLCRAGNRERRRGAVCCSSGGRRPHRGGAEVCPGRTDPQRGGMIQRIEGGAASWAGRCWRSRKKKKTGRAGRVACSACFAVCRCSLFSAAAGLLICAAPVMLHRLTVSRSTECHRGTFTGRRGGTFAASGGGYTLHLTGLRSRCRALT